MRVLILLKNGNCISLAYLGLGAKSLKTAAGIPQLSESLGHWQEVTRGKGEGGGVN